MNNETNIEENKVYREEKPVLSNRDHSGEDQIAIDEVKDSEEKEAAEHTSQEYDSNVYYSNQNTDWDASKPEDNQQPERNPLLGQSMEQPQDGRKISLFGQTIRPAKLPKITSKEEARKIFFGQSIDYYEKYYSKLQETKKKISWNWAAFILNVYWFVSRKMYAYALLSMLCKAMFTVVGYNIYDNMSNPNMQSMLLPCAALFLVVDVLIGMFANYLYISHMESKIVYPGESELSNDDLAKVIIMRGGFTITGVFMCLLLSDLLVYGLQYVMTLF